MGLRGRDRIRLWAVPILLAWVALAFDAADWRVPFSVLASGALDEVAHLATGALGLLALACFIDPPRRFYVAGLIASVAIDLDHVRPQRGGRLVRIRSRGDHQQAYALMRWLQGVEAGFAGGLSL